MWRRRERAEGAERELTEAVRRRVSVPGLYDSSMHGSLRCSFRALQLAMKRRARLLEFTAQALRELVLGLPAEAGPAPAISMMDAAFPAAADRLAEDGAPTVALGR